MRGKAPLETLQELAAAHRLEVVGVLPTRLEDNLPPDIDTLVLLGPHQPGFWEHLNAQPEGGQPDPVDRYSQRSISFIAQQVGGQAYFPFGGPPYRPFYRWALRSGQCWDSPLRLLVHESQGLWLSFRGAVGLSCSRHAEEAAGEDEDEDEGTARRASRPCTSCAAPCTQACPVQAFGSAGYDVERCQNHLRSPQGAECLTGGCLARRSCPISQRHPRSAAQSAYHMRRFMGLS